MPADVLRTLRQAAARGGGRAMREPLVQFFAVAVVLFAANSLIHGPERRAPGAEILVPEGRVSQIAESYRLLGGRMPSKAELQDLVDDYVDEEVAYREAVAMGLDSDDAIVRRRLRQKLEFLLEDADATEEPSERELAAWLRSHAADYRLPQRVAFRQVLLDGDVRGVRAEGEARGLLVSLKAGADPDLLGDGSMLPRAVPLTTRQGVAVLFGDGFAESLFKETSQGWFGPVASPLGQHLVLVMAREAGRDPTLDEVRAKVRSDWIEARRAEAKRASQEKLRERYKVDVRWPEPYASQRLPGEPAR
jgi:hypothetical protein